MALSRSARQLQNQSSSWLAITCLQNIDKKTNDVQVVSWDGRSKATPKTGPFVGAFGACR